VPILENLKGTMHDIIVCIIVYDYFSFELLSVLETIFFGKLVLLEKILKIGFLDKTEWRNANSNAN
jgi:hypothetical protein